MRERSSGFGAPWFHEIGEPEELIEKAREIKQRMLFGIGFARSFGKS